MMTYVLGSIPTYIQASLLNITWSRALRTPLEDRSPPTVCLPSMAVSSS